MHATTTHSKSYESPPPPRTEITGVRVSATKLSPRRAKKQRNDSCTRDVITKPFSFSFPPNSNNRNQTRGRSFSRRRRVGAYRRRIMSSTLSSCAVGFYYEAIITPLAAATNTPCQRLEWKRSGGG